MNLLRWYKFAQPSIGKPSEVNLHVCLKKKNSKYKKGTSLIFPHFISKLCKLKKLCHARNCSLCHLHPLGDKGLETIMENLQIIQTGWDPFVIISHTRVLHLYKNIHGFNWRICSAYLCIWKSEQDLVTLIQTWLVWLGSFKPFGHWIPRRHMHVQPPLQLPSPVPNEYGMCLPPMSVVVVCSYHNVVEYMEYMR